MIARQNQIYRDKRDSGDKSKIESLLRMNSKLYFSFKVLVFIPFIPLIPVSKGFPDLLCMQNTHQTPLNEKSRG
jgi:hypothetical protein